MCQRAEGGATSEYLDDTPEAVDGSLRSPMRWLRPDPSELRIPGLAGRSQVALRSVSEPVGKAREGDEIGAVKDAGDRGCCDDSVSERFVGRANGGFDVGISATRL